MLTKSQIRKKTIKCKLQFKMFYHAKNDNGFLPSSLACINHSMTKGIT